MQKASIAGLLGLLLLLVGCSSNQSVEADTFAGWALAQTPAAYINQDGESAQ
ncbi:hypothetical protein PQC53_31890 (plasmid) [Pseudomonas aeruginosa]|nr:hypothetical protein PQC53_31890 [Pseudomonas aeruginosa]